MATNGMATRQKRRRHHQHVWRHVYEITSCGDDVTTGAARQQARARKNNSGSSILSRGNSARHQRQAATKAAYMAAWRQ